MRQTAPLHKRWLAALALLLTPLAAVAGWLDTLNMPVGVTKISAEVYDLHMRILLVCVAIGIVVFSVMIYSIFMHRKSRGVKAASFHESTTVEIVWTVVPLVILVVMALPAAKLLIRMEDTTAADMSIKVTGYQWRWRYDYLDDDISFYSQLDPVHNAARQRGSGVDVESIPNYLKEVDEALVVPVGKKIRFLHTAVDVIHSWWVPDLALKRDAIPGFINENWAIIEEPGIYRGKCAELCGRDHGFMPVVVKAVSQEDYDAWVAERKNLQAKAEQDLNRDWTAGELIAAGHSVYQNNCQGCHQAEGQGIEGLFPPLAGSAVVDGDVDNHLTVLLNGVADTPMDGYPGLSDTELAAVMMYTRNGFGTPSQEIIQPRQVNALRDTLLRNGNATASVLAPQDISIETGVNGS